MKGYSASGCQVFRTECYWAESNKITSRLPTASGKFHAVVVIAPQGHFRRTGQHPIVGFQAVRPEVTLRGLFGELDGRVCQSPRF